MMTTFRVRCWAGLLLLSLSAPGVGVQARMTESPADSDVLEIGHDADLAAGKRAAAVVSILGSARSEGDADAVVAVLGDAHVTGPVKESAVTLLGDAYIDAKLGGGCGCGARQYRARSPCGHRGQRGGRGRRGRG